MDPASRAAPAQLSTDQRLQILSQTLGFRAPGPAELNASSAEAQPTKRRERRDRRNRGLRARSDQGLSQAIMQAMANSPDFSAELNKELGEEFKKDLNKEFGEDLRAQLQPTRLEDTQRRARLNDKPDVEHVAAVDALSIERDGDAQIDRRGSDQAFAELAKLDNSADGVINLSDEFFAQLRLLAPIGQGRLVERSLASTDRVEIGPSDQAQTQALNQYDRISHMAKWPV